jgi:hypothetical protein
VNLLADDPAPADPRRVTREAERTADRLRGLTVVRLRVALPESDTRAERAFRLAQELADEAAALAGWPQRSLPVLPDTAAGDVLAVCATDLVEVLDAAADPQVVSRVSESVVARLIALRQVL